MRFFRFLFTLVWLTVVTATLFGQTADPVRMRRYGLGDGLPNEQTRQVVALPDDRMFVVVEGQTALFDGERFQPLEYEQQQAVGVESFLNTDHWLTADGRLWIREMHRLLVLDTHDTPHFLSPPMCWRRVG